MDNWRRRSKNVKWETNNRDKTKSKELIKKKWGPHVDTCDVRYMVDCGNDGIMEEVSFHKNLLLTGGRYFKEIFFFFDISTVKRTDGTQLHLYGNEELGRNFCYTNGISLENKLRESVYCLSFYTQSLSLFLADRQAPSLLVVIHSWDSDFWRSAPPMCGFGG